MDLYTLKANQTMSGLGFKALIDLNLEAAFMTEPGRSDGIILRISDEFNPVSGSSIRIPPASDANVCTLLHFLK